MMANSIMRKVEISLLLLALPLVLLLLLPSFCDKWNWKTTCVAKCASQCIVVAGCSLSCSYSGSK